MFLTNGARKMSQIQLVGEMHPERGQLGTGHSIQITGAMNMNRHLKRITKRQNSAAIRPRKRRNRPHGSSLQQTESLEVRQLLSADPVSELAQMSDEFEDANSLTDWSRLHQTEGWNADQLQVWDVNHTQAGRMTMIPETVVWYQDWRGPMAFKEVTGDFVFTTEVHITDRDDVGGSDSDNVPGDAQFSLGGVMIRTPRDISGPADWSPGSMRDDGTNNGENYVFLSLGYGSSANEFSLEVKTTRNSDSQLELTPLGSDVDTVRVQIARVGDTVLTLFQQTGQAWQVHRRYSRPDLPQTMQVGLVTYTDWDKANDFTPLFHNSNVLTPDGADPTPAQPFNPDVVAGFEYARFARPQLPAGITAGDLVHRATDHQILGFLGDNATESHLGHAPTMSQMSDNHAVGHAGMSAGHAMSGSNATTPASNPDDMSAGGAMDHVDNMSSGGQMNHSGHMTPSGGMVHAAGDQRGTEHMSLFQMFPHANASHMLIADGNWSDSGTWAGGAIPSSGATVLIPAGRTVTYDVRSDTALDWVRVDGTLQFAQNMDTRLVVGTLVTDYGSSLEMGTQQNPIQAGHTAQILIADAGPIDISNDPLHLSRGVVTHGRTRVFGADKLDFVALEADVFSGDSELALSLPDGTDIPTGWRVGDELVLGGTAVNPEGSHADNSRFQDEVLTIRAINGNRITFINNDLPVPSSSSGRRNDVLRFDHARPAGYESAGLSLYVANTTRNVQFETQNADDLPISQRGHVMFMHNPDVQVHNAGFRGMGRTDKSRLLDDPTQNVDGSPGQGTNPRGRYALHFHRAGAENIVGNRAVARGNAIVGSPGWGIVHHDSHLELTDNVVFDVVGSGIVAEAGNEIGDWNRNIVIKTTGDLRLDSDLDTQNPRARRFDFGFNGESYWVQGAGQINMTDNVSISAAGAGINLFGTATSDQRDVMDVVDVAANSLAAEERHIVTTGNGRIGVEYTPMRRMSGFESYNSEMGIVVWRRMRNDDGQLGFIGSHVNQHEERSLIEDFKLWNIHGQGVFMQYSTSVDLLDGFILGDPDNPIPYVRGAEANGRGYGISSNGPTQDITYQNLRIEGFERGLKLNREGVNRFEHPDRESLNWGGSRLVDSVFANNTTHLDFNSSFGQLGAFPDYFEIENTQFVSPASNQAPHALFQAQSVGDHGVVVFDAGASFDVDPDHGVDRLNAGLDWPKFESMHLGGNAITSYAWDFDADGVTDDFGRIASHQFDSAGQHTVTLTVWDTLGASSSHTQTLSAMPAAYANLVTDGTFDNGLLGRRGYDTDSSRAGEGWIADNWMIDPTLGDGGAAVVSGGPWNVGLGQVYLDSAIRKGMHSLSLDARNLEGDEQENQISVRVWGVDGEFDSVVGRGGPTRVGMLPMSRSLLLDEMLGGHSFDWTTYNWNVDFGAGYQYLYLQISVHNEPDPTAGDLIAVDNIVLGDSPGPVATNDRAVTQVDRTVTLDLTRNDKDLNGGALSLTDIQQPTHGRAVINANGSVDYTPLDSYFGQDRFQYTIRDNQGYEATADVEIDVQQIDDDRLVAHLSMDGDHGRIVEDRSRAGYRNTGILWNGATRDVGFQGGSVSFVGADDHLRLPDSPNINTADQDEFTVSVWFRADDVDVNSRHQVIYEQGAGWSGGLNIYLAQGRLHAGAWDRSTGWSGEWLSTDQVQSGRWHHVAVTLDGGPSMTVGALRGYLDGVEFGRADGTQLSTSHGNVALGNVNDGTLFHDIGQTVHGHRHGFSGDVDELLIYNRAISTTEVHALSAAQSQLMFDINTLLISEDGGSNQVSATVRRSGSVVGDLVVSLQSSDPASLAVPAAVTIPDGQSEVLVPINVLDNAVHDADRSVTITGSGNGQRSAIALLHVADDEPVPVSMTSSDLTALESGADSAAVTVTRHTSDLSQPLTVQYTLGGTAIAGVDYAALPGQVTIPVGARSASVLITPIDDSNMETSETVRMWIDPRSSYIATQASAVDLTIVDDDSLRVSDQAMGLSENSRTLDLAGNGLAVHPVYTAEVVENRLWNVDQQHGFYQTRADYGENWGGYQERWIRASNDSDNWHYLLPNGDLHRWQGSFEQSALIASLGPEVYDDPSLLHDARRLDATVHVDQGRLLIDPGTGYVGTFTVALTGIELGVVNTQTFTVTVVDDRLPLVIGDQTMQSSQDVLALALPTSAVSDDADYRVEILENKLWQLDQQLGFYQPLSDYGENWGGQQERWIRAANDGDTWYYLLPNGELHRWQGGFDQSPVVASVGTAVYANPDMLHEAQHVNASVRIVEGQLLVDPGEGFVGRFTIALTNTQYGRPTTHTFSINVIDSPALVDQALAELARNGF